jgi:OOP family OmpA-OmpF porin
MRFGLLRWFGGLAAAMAVWAGASLYLQTTVEADLIAGARDALGSVAQSWAKVTVRGRDVEIEGEAPSSADKQRVFAALKRVAGVRLIRDATTVLPDSDRFAWSATRTRDRVLLSGFASEDDRAPVLDEVRRLFPKAEVVDRTRIAGGAPEGFPAVAAVALRQLARLPDGEVALDGRTVAVRGSAPDVGAYAAIRAARSDLPAGFGLDLSGLAPAPARPFVLSVASDGDALVLSGFAPSEAAHGALLRAVAEARPSAKVTDNLRIATGLPPGMDFGAAARFALASVADLKSGTVTITDGMFEVHGAALDKQGVVDIAARARDRLPTGMRAGKLSLTADPVERYRFVAKRTGDGLELSGHYPDAQTRDAVAGVVEQLYFEGVDDKLRLGDGAPRGFAAAVTFGLQQLSQLAAGEVAIEAGAIRITGETAYPQLASLLRDRIPKAAPAGFRAAADINADPPATASVR